MLYNAIKNEQQIKHTDNNCSYKWTVSFLVAEVVQFDTKCQYYTRYYSSTWFNFLNWLLWIIIYQEVSPVNTK